MAHLVSPISYRSGKTFLWHNSDSQAHLKKGIGSSIGLETSLNYLLRQHNYYIIRSTAKVNCQSGLTTVKFLYYPIVNPILRPRQFPTFLTQYSLLDFTISNNYQNFKASLSKIWILKQLEFSNRFIAPKVRRQLNKWLTAGIFRGSSGHNLVKRNLIKQISFKPFARLLNSRYKKSHKRHKKLCQRSDEILSAHYISRLISLRLGKQIIVKPLNVFNYLIKKFGRLNYYNHQQHIWGKYHPNKKYFRSYYDLVNALYVLAYIPLSEHLVISIIQYALLRMHRRKIKPKRLFVFIGQVINSLPDIRENFHACRIIITGKLKGGTARTSSLSFGFGIIPWQSLTENIRFDFGDLRSKYGAFGIKFLTWRK